MNSGSYSASELRAQQVSIRSESQSDGQNFGYLSVTEKMPHGGIRAPCKQLSELQRNRIIELKEAGWGNCRMALHMGRKDSSIKRSWQKWVEMAGS
ncbi:hypothetical protein TNCV_4360601 [Trichonephila clavipes]|uniref:Uncharacterized protein n=1 Tax=Trichonephila clavipes TaxID=2585209 RepID=A0A8X6WA91_TRICX|nr:hypothetical protein TNCV_4360601 [Trichonephila clavipes]